jgi:hypothetical protein
MDIETWQVLAGLAGLLIVYMIGVAVLNLPASVFGFLTMAFFIGLGVVLGRLLSRVIS